jgi:hypothetical protein
MGTWNLARPTVPDHERFEPEPGLSRRRLLRGILAGSFGTLVAACTSAPEVSRDRSPLSRPASATPSVPPSVSGPIAQAPGTAGSAGQDASPGALLSFAQFYPPTLQVLPTLPGGWSDVAGEHLTVSFDGPRSGAVLLVMSAVVRNASSEISQHWGVRGTGGSPQDENIVRDSMRWVFGFATPEVGIRVESRAILDVEPGRKYRWTWAFRPDECAILVGRDPGSPTAPEGYGPATIELWDTSR